jgi:hypothetical protein
VKGGDCGEVPLCRFRPELGAFASADCCQLRQIAAHVADIRRKRIDPVARAKAKPTLPVRAIRPLRIFCESVPVETIGEAVKICQRGFRETGIFQGRHKSAIALPLGATPLAHVTAPVLVPDSLHQSAYDKLFPDTKRLFLSDKYQ